MSWELYEVWAEDDDGHEELVDTTQSLKEAKSLAQKTINEGAVAAWINQETGDGDFREIDRLTT